MHSSSYCPRTPPRSSAQENLQQSRCATYLALHPARCLHLYKAGRVPNSTEEELHEEWNQSPISNHFHGLVTASQKLREEAGIQVLDRHNASKPSDEVDPPWKREPPETHRVLPGLTKEDSPHILVSHVMELITNRYEGNFHIYTDGSVAEDGSAGAGV